MDKKRYCFTLNDQCIARGRRGYLDHLWCPRNWVKYSDYDGVKLVLWKIEYEVSDWPPAGALEATQEGQLHHPHWIQYCLLYCKGQWLPNKICLKNKWISMSTGKSLSESLLFAEHGENMLCTKIVLNVRNNFCT